MITTPTFLWDVSSRDSVVWICKAYGNGRPDVGMFCAIDLMVCAGTVRYRKAHTAIPVQREIARHIQPYRYSEKSQGTYSRIGTVRYRKVYTAAPAQGDTYIVFSRSVKALQAICRSFPEGASCVEAGMPVGCLFYPVVRSMDSDMECFTGINGSVKEGSILWRKEKGK